MNDSDHCISRSTLGRWAAAVPLMVGLLVMALGLTVIIGWHARFPLLIQLHPTFAPMKYNTALCFLCAGGALLAIGLEARRLALLLGFAVAAVGLLTLAEYVFDAELGIDQFFFRTYIFTQTSHPGRMSPVAALIFLMVGLATISGGILHRHRGGRLAAGLLGSLVVALSSMALLGYVTGLTGTYGWGLLSRMALHTASGFLSLGIALFIIAWLQELAMENRSPRWLPVSTALAAASATVVLWHALSVREQEQMGEIVQANGALVRNEILASLESELHSLGHLASTWDNSGQPPREIWETAAASHFNHSSGYSQIAWMTPDLQVRWVASREDDEKALAGGIDGTEQRATFEMARQSGRPRFSGPVELEPGHMGILAVVPIHHQSRFEGWITGVIRLRELLDATLRKDLADGYAMTLAGGGKQFYERSGELPPSGQGRVTELPIHFHGVDWIARVWPRAELLAAQRSHFTEAVLILGILASTLIGLTVHLAQGAISKSQELAAANRGLQHEMVERNRAEEELKGSEKRFSTAFEHASIGMALVSPDGRWLKVNRALCGLIGYTKEEFHERTFQDVTHPDDLETDLAQVREILAGKILSYEMEKRYFHKDGRVVWVLLSASLVRDARGAPLHFIAQIQDITERKEAEAALDTMHNELVGASRRAGMAEVATSVLHNVGNVLNSVNISCSVAAEKIRKSRIDSVKKTADLLDEHAADLPAFIAGDPRGRKLPEFLGNLAGRLAEEQSEVLEELQLLAKNIDHIKQIVVMQQGYAKVTGITETVKVEDLVEDSLRINADALTRHDVEVVREYDEVPPITIEKHKAMQILVNLIRNAKQACDDSGVTAKKMTVRVTNGEGRVRVAVIDNGVGIPPENLTRIFAHGFTTKSNGHGFGLHGGALAARELGGALTVHSDGGGSGATFTLELPVDPPGDPGSKP